MPKRFVCKFAVGQNDLAYSGIWRVWTARNQPDLYLAVENIAGQLKATVHCPRPPHVGWRRHLGFPIEASGEVAVAVKKDSGPHPVQWGGCAIGPDCTLEYRVIFRGKSLAKNGFRVPVNTALLPVPSEHEAVEVAVLLGPTGPSLGHPRYKDASTHLLSEGHLSNGRRVWVVYYTTAIESNDTRAPQQQSIIPAKNYVDRSLNVSKGSMRAALFGPQSDGHLAFWDMRAEITARNDDISRP